MLLEPEYRQAFAAWRNAPGPEANTALLAALSPVLDSALRTYAPGPASPALRARARLLALRSLGRYDPARAGLRTYLMNQLQSLRREAGRESQAVRLPERAAQELARMRRAESELADELGRDPSSHELADRAGLSLARIARLRRAGPGLSEGQVAAAGLAEGEQGGMPAVLGRPDYHPAWLSFVHNDLHPADQVILEHTFGLHGRPVLPKVEIARKLGLSPGAVSQRAARIQARLDARDAFGGLF